VRISICILLAAILLLLAGHAAASPADLRATAHEYYEWRDAAYPVATSDQGEHRYDNRLNMTSKADRPTADA
jgi:hypothetical protein